MLPESFVVGRDGLLRLVVVGQGGAQSVPQQGRGWLGRHGGSETVHGFLEISGEIEQNSQPSLQQGN